MERNRIEINIGNGMKIVVEQNPDSGNSINILQYIQAVFNHESALTMMKYTGVYDALAAKLIRMI